MSEIRLHGIKAIEWAKANDLELCKYNDPIENERFDLTIDEAMDIYREDPGLIYIDVDEEL